MFSKPLSHFLKCDCVQFFEGRLIVSGQQKTTWFSTSHEQPPRLLALSPSLIVAAPNFLQNLWPGTLGPRRTPGVGCGAGLGAL